MEKGAKLREALFYETRPDGRVKCLLCPRGCVIGEGQTGVCRGRRNLGGTLYAINYGRTVSLAVDPIEKKPLYSFYPGTMILSIAPNGCNLACRFCQNWEISQRDAPTQQLGPEHLTELARKYRSVGVAYTYTEPLVWYEYLLDACQAIREAGMVNVLVTNGYINPEPLDRLLPLVDALNIDIKSMEETFYREYCKGSLEPVLHTAKAAKETGCHVEITNLIIPTLNDAEKTIDRLIDWVAEELGVDTPLHFSRYFPRYQLTIPPTPVSTLGWAYQRARTRLRYVYVGNVLIEGASDTYCYNCGAPLITRFGYQTSLIGIEDGHCRECGAKVEVVGL